MLRTAVVLSLVLASATAAAVAALRAPRKAPPPPADPPAVVRDGALRLSARLDRRWLDARGGASYLEIGVAAEGAPERGPRTAVAWKQVYCAPCRLRKCGDPICMTTLEVEEALELTRTV